jgi:hypothetical protein
MVSRFDQLRVPVQIAAAALLTAYGASSPAAPPATAAVSTANTASPASAYPTYARVQYVEECMVRSGRSEADLYKCSCAIDRIAARLTYDQFVEASTYAHYATLGGENAGIFRDHPLAQRQAKLMRSIESAAWHACGLPPPAP